jgi:hypothetical protein
MTTIGDPIGVFGKFNAGVLLTVTPEFAEMILAWVQGGYRRA